MKVSRQELISCITEEVKSDVVLLEKSRSMAEMGATHGESKKEGKYDTRAVEASYLAEAQAVRLQELKQKLDGFLKEVSGYIDPSMVRVGCAVHLKSYSDQEKILFLSRNLGGYTFEVRTIKVAVVSVNSPVAKTFKDLSVGDVEVIQGCEWEIVRIF